MQNISNMLVHYIMSSKIISCCKSTRISFSISRFLANTFVDLCVQFDFVVVPHRFILMFSFFYCFLDCFEDFCISTVASFANMFGYHFTLGIESKKQWVPVSHPVHGFHHLSQKMQWQFMYNLCWCVLMFHLEKKCIQIELRTEPVGGSRAFAVCILSIGS